MMSNTAANLLARVQGRYQRTVSRALFKRPMHMGEGRPLISFTFDDFPRSALQTGGEILRASGCRGTYYVSFGLMGKHAPTGEMFLADDVHALLEQGHELGCHTFDHHHSWETDPETFEESIRKNGRVLQQLHPALTFRSFSYPIAEPRPESKRRAAGYFECCRGGGQAHNAKEFDLSLLRSFFIEKCRDTPERFRLAIEQNRRDRGWLIFSTHDVSDSPTRYGCTPGLFREIVRMALDSGASVLPVASALDAASAVTYPP